MRKEIFVNQKYNLLYDPLTHIPEDFDLTGKVLHSGRNVIKELEIGGNRLVIKYFKRITFINRILFSTFRKSKAQRTYDNTILLLAKGINTPEPVAYINCYWHGLLSRCYFVSLFDECRSINELFSLPLPEPLEALKYFGRFTFRLHKLGIFHNDYNLDNVMYSFDNNGYSFSLIDNNRVRFLRYKFIRGLRDMRRIYLPVDKLGILVEEYAKEAQSSDIITLKIIIIYRLNLLFWKGLKRRIKRYYIHK
jgi:hypothetical protein